MKATSRALPWIVLGLLAAAVFRGALTNPFVYDDVLSIVENTLIRQLDVSWAFFRGGISSEGFANGQFRPVTLLTFTLNYLVGGLDPFGYRLVNLGLHLANGLLLVAFARRLLRLLPLSGPAATPDDKSVTVMAFLAGALFLVHPLSSLSVLLVWKRATLLFSLFSLVAAHGLLSLRALPATASWRRRLPWYAGILAAQLLALGSKENAAILPALLVLLDLSVQEGGAPSVKEVAKRQWPMLLVGVAAAGFLLSLSPVKGDRPPLAYLAMQLGVIWRYLAMIVAPHWVDTIYDVPVRTFRDPSVWLAGLGLLVLVAAALRWFRRYPLPAFAILWALIALSPTSSVMPIPLAMDEDRVYQAFMPLWILPPLGLWKLAGALAHRARIVAPLLGGICLLVLLTLTVSRAALWADPEVLWASAVRDHPDSSSAATNYCGVLTTLPARQRLAVGACRNAYERFPNNPITQYNLIYAYIKVGAGKEARALAAQLVTRPRPSAMVLRIAGHLAFYAGDYAAAATLYARALAQSPMDAETAIFLARTFCKLGRLQDGIALAAQLERWALPPRLDLRLGLANLHLALAQTARACAEYTALLPRMGGYDTTDPERKDLVAACAAPTRQ